MTHPLPCPLCQSEAHCLPDDIYYRCDNCEGHFLPESRHPDPASEKTRYEMHNNDVNDPRYQTFVSPVTQAILSDFTRGHEGLDFGAGPGPVVSKVLQDHGYHISLYDPYFHPDAGLLEKTYDYIVCCEVIEHFFAPAKEFARLKGMLRSGGALYCMTHVLDESIDFAHWYYRRDLTHVFIYTAKTLQWIREHFAFRELIVNGRLIVFR